MAFRTKRKSVKELVDSIQAAAAHEEYDPRADMALLREQYPQLRGADYCRLLDAMCEKYDNEWSLIHAALANKALNGDIEAIKLLREDMSVNNGEGSGVSIVDDIG